MTRPSRPGNLSRFAIGLSVATFTLVVLLEAGGVRATTVTVAAMNFQFSPQSQTVTVGDIVHWTFSGDPHSVTSRDGQFDSGIMNPGGSFQFRFTTAGVFKYFCQVHPEQMFGSITVKAAAATPRPTVRPTANPTPRPTVRPTVRPSPSPTPSSSPSPTPSPTPSPSSPPPPSPSDVSTPTASAAASLALVETSLPTSGASPGPAPTSPTNATDSTAIVVVVVVLAAVAGGGLLLARRRRST